jgi:hypothetical protein
LVHGEALAAFQQRDRFALRGFCQGADGERRVVPFPGVRVLVERGETAVDLVPRRLKCIKAALLDFGFVIHFLRAVQKLLGLAQLLQSEVDLTRTSGSGGRVERVLCDRSDLRGIFVGNRLVFDRLLEARDLGVDLRGSGVGRNGTQTYRRKRTQYKDKNGQLAVNFHFAPAPQTRGG